MKLLLFMQKSKILKKLLFLPLFFIFSVQGYFCPLHNHFAFTNALQTIDCKSHRMYPVAKPCDQVRMILVPAGDDEQAQCLIAATYRALQEQTFDKIIVLCPSHVLFHGVALPHMTSENCYLENIPIQTDVLERLSQYALFHYYQVPFCDNNPLQQQYQFLDFYGKKNIAIVPLIVGQLSQDDALEVAVIIASCCTDHTLIILSADIASRIHVMHSLPLDQSKICAVYDQDAKRIQALQSGSLEQQISLFDDNLHTSLFAILFELLQLAQCKNVTSDFIGYATSSVENMHDLDVQSYGAFMFQAHQQLGYKNHVGCYEQSQLLQHARGALQDLFAMRSFRLPMMTSYEMLQPHGLFASLLGMSDHGKILKGCMGKVQSKRSLCDMVYCMTQQAARKDLRFYPLQEKDLENTIISLSLITDFTKVFELDIICEFDGLVLRYDDKEAIALPVKTVMPNWSYEQALINLSHQMGTNSFVWKKPRAQIFTFRSIIFQEE